MPLPSPSVRIRTIAASTSKATISPNPISLALTLFHLPSAFGVEQRSKYATRGVMRSLRRRTSNA
jgi:hypothetical protein